jgi:large subunit ribosomal protein L21
MYAVIKTGGKQQRVKPGDVIEVERIVHEGETISFQPLLVVDDDGATHVGKRAAGATVTAKPLGEKKGEKIRVLRYRPKTGYAKRTGHRQLLTLLEIEAIELGGGAKRGASARAAAREPAPAEAPADAASDEEEAPPGESDGDSGRPGEGD